jgi:hypothetical protein
MDEIRKLSNAEKKDYSMRIYSDRLLNLIKQCSIDGTWSEATGEMILLKGSSRWLVEYLCPSERETFRKWTPDIDALTKQIAKDVLGEENKDR